MPWLGAIAFGLCAAASLASCSGDVSELEQSPETAPLNAILILVDTLRADHLSSYGYERTTSPTLDAFAAGGVYFEDNRSQTACTNSSVTSLLTSRYPIAVERKPGLLGIPDDVPSLASILQRRNYATIGISASLIVRNTPSVRNHTGGFGQGFDVFHEECADADAACVNRAAFDAIDATNGPFFLYLHYLDPHSPYAPPPAAARPYSAAGSPASRAVGEGRPFGVQQEARRDGRSIEPEEVAHLVDLYDDEIAYFDGAFGDLIAGLRDRRLLDRSVIVLASDHGEAFMERGYMGHCATPLFEAMTRTPLLLRIPGLATTGAVTAPVENVDIAPTILDYLGVEIAGLGLEGRSLRPLIEGDADSKPFTFAAQNHQISASDREYTLIYDLIREDAKLFERNSDPDFTTDLSASHPERSRKMLAALLEWFEAGGAGKERYLERTRDLDRQLRALGYIE